jgi:hypothetical protein
MATRASIDASLPKVIIFVASLILGLLELGHTALLPGDDIVATIAPIATWWTALLSGSQFSSSSAGSIVAPRRSAGMLLRSSSWFIRLRRGRRNSEWRPVSKIFGP